MSHIPQKTIKKIIQKHYNLLHYNNMKSQCFLFFLWILAEMSTATFCPWKVRVCQHLFVVKNIQIHQLVPDVCTRVFPRTSFLVLSLKQKGGG